MSERCIFHDGLTPFVETSYYQAVLGTRLLPRIDNLEEPTGGGFRREITKYKGTTNHTNYTKKRQETKCAANDVTKPRNTEDHENTP